MKKEMKGYLPYAIAHCSDGEVRINQAEITVYTDEETAWEVANDIVEDHCSLFGEDEEQYPVEPKVDAVVIDTGA